MSLLIKRIALIVISMIVGAVLTWAIITFLLDTSVAEYGPVYFPLTAFFFGISIALIADRFAGTEFLPK
jgi:uncharacterized membrane protein